MASRAPQSATEVQITIRSATSERFEVFPVGAHVIVGRHTSCQLRLESDTVSRQHVVLELGRDAMRVEDISTNGTLAGEKLLRREATQVPYGTTISLGEFVLSARPTADAPPPVEAPPERGAGPWGGRAAATAIAPIEQQPQPPAAAATASPATNGMAAPGAALPLPNLVLPPITAPGAASNPIAVNQVNQPMPGIGLAPTQASPAIMQPRPPGMQPQQPGMPQQPGQPGQQVSPQMQAAALQAALQAVLQNAARQQ